MILNNLITRSRLAVCIFTIITVSIVYGETSDLYYFNLKNTPQTSSPAANSHLVCTLINPISSYLQLYSNKSIQQKQNHYINHIPQNTINKKDNNQQINIKTNLFIILLSLFLVLFVFFSISLFYGIQNKCFLCNIVQRPLFSKERKKNSIRFETKMKGGKLSAQLNPKQKYQHIFQQLVETVESKQLFLDPNLTQLDVIKYLGTNRNYLYMALKLHTNTNCH